MLNYRTHANICIRIKPWGRLYKAVVSNIRQSLLLWELSSINKSIKLTNHYTGWLVTKHVAVLLWFSLAIILRDIQHNRTSRQQFSWATAPPLCVSPRESPKIQVYDRPLFLIQQTPDPSLQVSIRGHDTWSLSGLGTVQPLAYGTPTSGWVWQTEF